MTENPVFQKMTPRPLPISTDHPSKLFGVESHARTLRVWFVFVSFSFCADLESVGRQLRALSKDYPLLSADVLKRSGIGRFIHTTCITEQPQDSDVHQVQNSPLCKIKIHRVGGILQGGVCV